MFRIKKILSIAIGSVVIAGCVVQPTFATGKHEYYYTRYNVTLSNGKTYQINKDCLPVNPNHTLCQVQKNVIVSCLMGGTVKLRKGEYVAIKRVKKSEVERIPGTNKYRFTGKKYYEYYKADLSPSEINGQRYAYVIQKVKLVDGVIVDDNVEHEICYVPVGSGVLKPAGKAFSVIQERTEFLGDGIKFRGRESVCANHDKEHIKYHVRHQWNCDNKRIEEEDFGDFRELYSDLYEGSINNEPLSVVKVTVGTGYMPDYAKLIVHKTPNELRKENSPWNKAKNIGRSIVDTFKPIKAK